MRQETLFSDIEMRGVGDHLAIEQLVYRYCRAVDRLDIPLGHSIWHDDGYADYGADYYQGSGKGLIDLICRQHRAMKSHSHQVSNILIDLDGDRAGSESYVTATLRLEGETGLKQIQIWARYLDAWEKRQGRWGIVRRMALYDHDEVRDVTPMGQPIRSTRDGDDPSYKFLSRRA